MQNHPRDEKWLRRRLDALERRLAELETAPQAGHTSVSYGTLSVQDPDTGATIAALSSATDVTDPDGNPVSQGLSATVGDVHGDVLTDGSVGPEKVNFTVTDIGGTTTTVADTAPADPHTNDLWVDTGNGNLLSQWNGTAWVPLPVGTEAIQALAVTASQIAANTITAAQIATGAITADELAANAVTAGKIDAGAVTADTLESSLVLATEIRSTDYVAGVSGWKIDSTSAEFNDADFRGDVLVGPDGGAQVRVYSTGSAGRVEVLSNDALENDPAHIVSGIFGSGSSKVIQTNYFGARIGATADRPVLVVSSESSDGSSRQYLSLGSVDPSGSYHEALTVYKTGVTFGRQDGTFLKMVTQPSTTGDGSWHAFSSSSWSESLPIARTVPPSTAIAVDLYMRAANRATANATIGLSLQVKVGSTVIWAPADTDTDSCAFDQNDGTTIIGASNYRRSWRTVVIGWDLLGAYNGQTISITPMYRISSGSNYNYAAASMTIRDLPDTQQSNVYS